jgi:hypothetical protein
MDWVTAAAREAMSAVSVLGVANVALSERMAGPGSGALIFQSMGLVYWADGQYSEDQSKDPRPDDCLPNSPNSSIIAHWAALWG